MRNIRATLCYDGTDFSGWQIQKEDRTVQGRIEAALAAVHGHPVGVIAAGRTDSGVHATGQVIHFLSDIDSIEGSRFREAINSGLDRDVRVIESREASFDFHARYSARVRIYRYFLYFGPVVLPHYHRYALRRYRRPNLKKINRMAGYLIGEHDFTSFCASGDESTSKKRVVFSSCFYPQGDFLVYKIAADAFLYRMVRNIVGTILECEEKAMPAEIINDILAARERRRAGQTIESRGLFLDKVLYDGEEKSL
ncbi:MAG: tRNA pseudouridine(38-40) synthase TruA [Spirochaetales bacterium]|nr:tRNA pseudouridine(38-40) synthase TruA [Spirochaetales bacterium]